MHADDATDEFDGTASGRCAPGLHLVLLLEGNLDLSYGNRRVVLTTACPRSAHEISHGWPSCAQAFLMNAIEPETFSRRIHRGNYARRLSFVISDQWLQHLQEASCAAMPARLRSLLSSHLLAQPWQPTPRAIALAEQIVRPPAYEPILQAIYLESRMLDLLAEALAPPRGSQSIIHNIAQTNTTGLSPRGYCRMAELRAFLSGAAANQLSLEDMARQMGMNANTMQRQFRSAYGTTIFDFLRESALQRARLALERDALSIKQAAALAGYTSPANFATAYKRRFGVTPKLAQRSGQR
ncbi:AraC family transcriptional regulator [Cupriavidus basilensis OR16]|uniref:AraC family transcriptional regulator n=2 Tax=Cupriavidus basilensis TaxID=68895 RepID=H1S865_9BURK|nr:AraC family transcriptional regulator [Cupriavidus basilensis OR16]